MTASANGHAGASPPLVPQPAQPRFSGVGAGPADAAGSALTDCEGTTRGGVGIELASISSPNGRSFFEPSWYVTSFFTTVISSASSVIFVTRTTRASDVSGASSFT